MCAPLFEKYRECMLKAMREKGIDTTEAEKAMLEALKSTPAASKLPGDFKFGSSSKPG